MRLKPSQREKKRYVVFEIVSDAQFAFRDVKDTIQQASLRYLGEFGTQKAHPIVMESMYGGNKGIVRVSRDALNDIKSTLTMIKRIQGKDVSVKAIGVSGILKKARMKFLEKNPNYTR